MEVQLYQKGTRRRAEKIVEVSMSRHALLRAPLAFATPRRRRALRNLKVQTPGDLQDHSNMSLLDRLSVTLISHMAALLVDAKDGSEEIYI